MANFLYVMAIVLAGIAVGVADALIKKTAASGNFWLSFKNPLMIVIILLYLAQIIFFVYVFAHNWQLGVVGILQMIFYSITVVVVGFLIFGETLTTIQTIGIIFGVIGAILINL